MYKNWDKLKESEILNLRFCDLGLKIKGSKLEPLIQSLYEELSNKGINFKPHVWISDEWFSPDGVPGFAVPFYLTHPRLTKLQKKMFLDAEGASERHCLKLLRHEAAHALDNAFRLRRLKKRQQIFGLSSTPYPEAYSPQAYSKKYVINLNSWYAQSHPDEDWAETFAVWLNPKVDWESRYRNWPALEKLYYMDEVMESIAKKTAPVKNKEKIADITKSKKKLYTYYDQKKEELGLENPYYLDPVLSKLFSSQPKYEKNGLAARFLRKERGHIIPPVAKWTGQYKYTISLILEEIITSCDEKKLYLTKNKKNTRMDLVGMLTAHTLNYITSGHHNIPM